MKKLYTDTYTFDKSSNITKKIDPLTGFLTMKAIISRVGIQDYYGMEISPDFDPLKVYKVFRPESEVFSEESMKSFINSPATDDHPEDIVSISNSSNLIKGSVSNVERDGDFLVSTMTITDKNLIDKVMNGKMELSAGYFNEIKEQKGEYNGETYDFIQTNIRANHVAVVDKGRCGGSCKLSLDKNVTINQNKGGTMVKLSINGEEYEVSQDASEAIEAMKKKTDEEIEAMKKDMEELEEEKKKSEDSLKELTATVDSLKGTLEATKAGMMTDADINKMVNERVSIIAAAKEVLGDKFSNDASPCDMKKAVIAKVYPTMNLDGKEPSYVSAVYDMAVVQHANIKKGLDAFGKELTQDNSDPVQKAHDNYKNNLVNAYKGGK